MRIVIVSLVVLGVAGVAGCNQNAPARPGSTRSPAPFALNLPACGKPPSPAPDPPPPGAVLPPGTRLTAIRRQAPLVQLNGYVASTPRQVRAWVEAQPGLDVVASEDEGYESELLVTDGTWRTFIKARAVCTDASLLAEVIAPANSGAVIPTPAGTPAP